MKIALILTTINIPAVLSLYRRLDLNVRFFVACDEKTPRPAYAFCEQLSECEVYSPDRQKELGWECSSLLGWNTIARRNIALLEALKWGADVIVSIDDDNIPIAGYFEHFYELWYAQRGSGERWYLPERSGFRDAVGCPFFNGLQVAAGGWFDPGHLSFLRDGIDPVCQRGFPQHLFGVQSFEPVAGARVGVAQGAVLGDPDTSAVDRISRHPQVHQVSELLRAGIVSDPRQVQAPLNSQNIAFLRELAPCFLMVPQFGRYDDIFAGLVAQRVMREFGFFVHYGKPFVWQQRNQHDLVRDLRAEMWGMEHVVEFTGWLYSFKFTSKEPLAMLRTIWAIAGSFGPMPEGVAALGEAWCADCERAMA